MTAIIKRKTILRAETSASFRGRPLLIELRPYAVFIREKGRRKGFEVDWESIFSLGAKKAAEQSRQERKAKKRRAGGY